MTQIKTQEQTVTSHTMQLTGIDIILLLQRASYRVPSDALVTIATPIDDDQPDSTTDIKGLNIINIKYQTVEES